MTSPLNTLSTGGKILVVDDEPAIVDAVSTALRYEGFDVEEAVERPRRALDGDRASSPT